MINELEGERSAFNLRCFSNFTWRKQEYKYYAIRKVTSRIQAVILGYLPFLQTSESHVTQHCP
jgi:hypothetical protein